MRDTCKSLDDASEGDVSSRERSLETRSIIATVGTIAGVAAIGTAGVLLLTSRKRAVAIGSGPVRGDGGAITVRGTF